MTSFSDRLEQQLTDAAKRQAEAPRRRPTAYGAWRIVQPLTAAAVVAVALAIPVLILAGVFAGPPRESAGSPDRAFATYGAADGSSLRIARDGYSLSSPGAELWGRVTVRKGRIVFSPVDSPSRGYAPAVCRSGDGEYLWTRRGNALELRVYRDRCTPRAEALTGRVWRTAPAP